MRTIKFRGQREDTKEWVYGDFIHYNEQFMINVYETEFGCWAYQVPIIPETVGQFTGLTDKNGTEIYEGDIVNCWGGEWIFGVWEYLEIIEILDIRGMYELTNVNWEGIEVVGNIHDNKEMK